MENFFKSYTFVLGFLIALIFFGLTMGEKTVQVFATLVLLSMVVLNSGKIADVLKQWNQLA
jgi:hypothetical protein